MNYREVPAFAGTTAEGRPIKATQLNKRVDLLSCWRALRKRSTSGGIAQAGRSKCGRSGFEARPCLP